MLEPSHLYTILEIVRNKDLGQVVSKSLLPPPRVDRTTLLVYQIQRLRKAIIKEFIAHFRQTMMRWRPCRVVAT